MSYKVKVALSNGLKRPGCPVRLADRAFTGDPTSLARDNVYPVYAQQT